MKCLLLGTECQKVGKIRSLPQLRRYFAMLRAFYHHWPEAHERQFFDEEEFRHWAQIRCGHYRVASRVPRRQFGTAASAQNVAQFEAVCQWLAKAAGASAEVMVLKTDIVVLVPKSIAFDKLSSSEASRLFDDVARFLEGETGLLTDQVMRETEAAK